MGLQLPRRTRIYQNWVIDSRRWNSLVHRADDIVIATSLKAGTTWMQAIISNLIFAGEAPAPVHELSPFMEARLPEIERVLASLEQQPNRRFIKTHLPLDGLPFDSSVKYVYVGRDTRDVFMSLWNHHSNYSEEMLALVGALPGRVGDMPPRYNDMHEMWRDWISRASFAWQHDGYPYWSHLQHAQSYWIHRHLPNILIVHYSDLLENLGREMQRIAQFLEIEIAAEKWPVLVHNCTFEAMRAKAEYYAPFGGIFWRGGAQTFFSSGRNNRWRSALTPDELALYQKAAERTLSPDCREWLEHA